MFYSKRLAETGVWRRWVEDITCLYGLLSPYPTLYDLIPDPVIMQYSTFIGIPAFAAVLPFQCFHDICYFMISCAL